MFNVQTINCMQYSEPFVDRNHAMKEIRTGNTLFKDTTISFNWKEAIWSLTKKKENKETRKKS